MKRVKTKGRNIGRKKETRRITEEALEIFLPLCYRALQDEFSFTLDDCEAWKARLDRYAEYVASGTVSVEDVRRSLRKGGFQV